MLRHDRYRTPGPLAHDCVWKFLNSYGQPRVEVETRAAEVAIGPCYGCHFTWQAVTSTLARLSPTVGPRTTASPYSGSGHVHQASL